MARYVRYIGLAHRRGITRDDWRSVGIDAESVWWDHTNGFHVSTDQFTDDQMRKVIQPDTGFIVVGTDEEPQPLPHDMTPSSAAAPRVNLNAAVGNEDDRGVDRDADAPENASANVPGPSEGAPGAAGGSRTGRGTTGRGSGKDV